MVKRRPTPAPLQNKNAWRNVSKDEYERAAVGDRAVRDIDNKRYYYIRKEK